MNKIFVVKNLFVVIVLSTLLFVCQESFAQKNKVGSSDGNTVSLVTSGTGLTKEEATKNALRTAIEQAFGTFVSANTSVVNDDLVKDEIVTITSGNIKSFEEINSRQVNSTEGNLFEVTLQAVVSIGNLVSFAQNHGMSAELAGQTFAMNIKMAQLNKENEKTALRHLIIQLYEIAKLGLYDFSISVQDPKMEEGKALVEAYVIPTPNANYKAYVELAKKTISSLSMSPTEYDNAQSSGMDVYVCGWKDKSVSERTGLVVKKDYFVQGKGEFRLRNNINEFNRNDVNEWFEISNGANFIYYYERFKYLSTFAFSIQDNLGNRIDPKQNLDDLNNYTSHGEKRIIRYGNETEYKSSKKIQPYDVKGSFKTISGMTIGKYELRHGFAGFDTTCGSFFLKYSLDDVSKLSKIDVVPQKINLLDNEMIMEALKGTASLKEMLEEAEKFFSYAKETGGEKKIRYLNMADDLVEMVLNFLPKDVDKSSLRDYKNEIKSELDKTL